MIEKLTKVVTGQEAADPLARLAVIAMPILLTILSFFAYDKLSSIERVIERNRLDIVDVAAMVTVMREGFAVQQQILQTGNAINADQEERLRVLERWQRAVNQQNQQ